MDLKDLAPFTPIVASLISSGLVAAVVSYFLNRRKYALDLKMIEAEIENKNAQTKQILLEITKRQEETLQGVKKNQADQQKELNDIADRLRVFSLAGYLYGHLQHLFFAKRGRRPLKYDRVDDHLRRELLFLADSGYIDHTDFWSITPDDDLTQKLNLTPTGIELVHVREMLEGRQYQRTLPESRPEPGQQHRRLFGACWPALWYILQFTRGVIPSSRHVE